MKVTVAAILALAATAAAENIKFTRAAPGQLLRRQDDGGYEPEIRECGDGNTCAEACGAGYEQCDSTDTTNHCFNPAAGETCCQFLGIGSSCNAGYFCAHDPDQSTVCCAEGVSLEDCAALNSAGALTSDPPVTSTAEPTSTAVESFNTTTTFAPSSTLSGSTNGTTSTTSKIRTGSAPTSTPTEVPPENGAASFVPATAAALLAVGAFAALF